MQPEIKIYPATINKTIKAPPSKSIMQRIIAGAVLSESKTTVVNPSYCDDCIAALNIAENLGCEIIRKKNEIIISPGKNEIKNKINCNESGLAMRMFTPVASTFGKNFEINGKGTLTKRPVNGICEALKQGNISCCGNNGYLPLNISGKLKGGTFKIDGSVSSQILTGLLFALPRLKENSEIFVSNLKSKPYIDLTLRILSGFNLEIENINYEIFKIKGNQKFETGKFYVEGDWSAAAFLIVAGLTAGKTRITGLNLKSEQADIKILEAVRKANGKIYIKKDTVIAEKSNLKSFNFDASDCPDLFPPLAVLAANAEGTSKIKGTKRLIHKESNRAEVIKKEFSKIGISVNIKNDIMTVKSNGIKSGTVNSHNDHRIAMAAGILALNSGSGITIKNPESVNKSYPDFFKDLFS